MPQDVGRQDLRIKPRILGFPDALVLDNVFKRVFDIEFAVTGALDVPCAE